MVVYVTSILAVVILGIIADLLLGGKRMGKFVRAIFSVLTILMMITSVISMIGSIGGKVFDFSGTVEVDRNYLAETASIKRRALEKGVMKALDEAGYRGTEVSIEVDFDSEITIKSVKVNLSKMVMDGNVSHINKYEAVERLVSQYLGADKGVIELYE